jgi:hypothetical protein
MGADDAQHPHHVGCVPPLCHDAAANSKMKNGSNSNHASLTKRYIKVPLLDLRDVQIAARHADPRTTMRYDRARKNLDRHPNYVLAAYMASGT